MSRSAAIGYLTPLHAEKKAKLRTSHWTFTGRTRKALGDARKFPSSAQAQKPQGLPGCASRETCRGHCHCSNGLATFSLGAAVALLQSGRLRQPRCLSKPRCSHGDIGRKRATLLARGAGVVWLQRQRCQRARRRNMPETWWGLGDIGGGWAALNSQLSCGANACSRFLLASGLAPILVMEVAAVAILRLHAAPHCPQKATWLAGPLGVQR